MSVGAVTKFMKVEGQGSMIVTFKLAEAFVRAGYPVISISIVTVCVPTFAKSVVVRVRTPEAELIVKND